MAEARKWIWTQVKRPFSYMLHNSSDSQVLVDIDASASPRPSSSNQQIISQLESHPSSSSCLPCSSTATPTRWKYDVFLSFRGPDTRKGITVDIHDRLQSRGIRTFMDDRDLEPGDPISRMLIEAIEESRFAVVVLSQNYAFSTWCLDELSKICECRANDHRIFPLFYHVDPAEVRHQNKGSFKEAFFKHETSGRHKPEIVKQWKADLKKVADISGWNTDDFKTHKELVEQAVKTLRQKVPPKNLVAHGDFLSTEGNFSWLSPSGDFAFGFQQLENNDRFLLSIWFAKIPDRTIVWCANGDKPAPSGSLVTLTANSGLVLTSPQGEQLWKSNQTTTGIVAHGVMNDTGNFVLVDEKSAKLWETFKNPTDTMLPGQILERGGKLSSRRSETDYSRGSFQLDFQDDGNLVFTSEKPFYSTATTSGTVPGSEGIKLVFNDSGDFYILRVNGGHYTFTSEKRAARDNYLRSTFSFDGVLAQYFLPKASTGNITWVALWSAPPNNC